jgi:hypothetical protein
MVGSIELENSMGLTLETDTVSCSLILFLCSLSPKVFFDSFCRSQSLNYLTALWINGALHQVLVKMVSMSLKESGGIGGNWIAEGRPLLATDLLVCGT